MSHVFFAMSIFLLAFLLITGCDNGGSSGAGSQKHYKIGDHVQAGPWVVTITHVGTNFGQDGVTPKRGDNFVVIYVVFNNNTSKNQALASNLFSLKDSTGKPANAMKNLTQYSSQQASAGSFIQATVVFEVSVSNPNFILSLSISPSGAQFWNFRIPAFSGPEGTATP